MGWIVTHFFQGVNEISEYELWDISRNFIFNYVQRLQLK